MISFNLIDEPWIPCRTSGGISKLGISQALVNAHLITEIYHPSPLATASLHRLLLAILHRNFGPADTSEWECLWEAGQWDEAILRGYFNRWYHRFNLFDDRRPFYQCVSLDFSYETSIAKLFYEMASGNNVTLFDHTLESSPPAILPDEAACALVAQQSFAVGGLITLEKGQDPAKFRSAENAPLTKGAVVLIKGANLFQTLILNLHRYCPQEGEPFDFDEAEDLPAWERDEETRPEERRPKGYLDLLTWQSRRIKFHPEENADGTVTVRKVVIMKGNWFPKDYSLHGKETMLAFAKNRRAATDKDPWPPITFQEDRALWRDSFALFQSVEGKTSRPKTLAWLSELVSEGIIAGAYRYNLSVMGLVTNKASVILWRHESLPLPLRYLNYERLLAQLKAGLDIAEEAGECLRASSWHLAQLLIVGDAKNINRQQKDEISELLTHLGVEQPFWAQLGIMFPGFISGLAEDVTTVGEDTFYGLNTIPWWAQEVRLAALHAFEEVVNSLDHSSRVLKAVAKAEPNFRYKLNNILDKALEPYKIPAERR